MDDALKARRSGTGYPLPAADQEHGLPAALRVPQAGSEGGLARRSEYDLLRQAADAR
jgi:hypothetical protein